MFVVGLVMNTTNHIQVKQHLHDSSADENNSRHSEGSHVPQPSGPLYEELQPKSTPEHQDLFELKENVAYGPIVKIIIWAMRDV